MRKRHDVNAFKDYKGVFLFQLQIQMFYSRTILPRLSTEELFPVSMPKPKRLRRNCYPARRTKVPIPWFSLLTKPVNKYGNCM